MAKVSNKHKAQGKKPVVVKESWWTPQRVKLAIVAIVAAVVIILTVACVKYVSGLQDSVVGTWSHEYADSTTEEAMEVELVFNKDMTCSFTRSREGEIEANMSGSYSIDDTYDVISMMLGADMSTVLQYYYDCDGDALEMKNFTSGHIDNYVKVNK